MDHTKEMAIQLAANLPQILSAECLVREAQKIEAYLHSSPCVGVPQHAEIQHVVEQEPTEPVKP